MAPFPSPPHIRVLLVAPYGPGGGGMGRCMDYLASAAPDGFLFRRIESRGPGPALLSPLYVAMAMLHIAWHRSLPGPAIVHINMAERGSVLRKAMLVYFCRALGLPCVLHLHAAEIVPFYDALPLRLQHGLRHMVASAGKVLVLGESVAQWLQSTLGITPDRIEVVRNGVPGPTTTPPPKLPGVFHLVFLGNLLPRKGVTDLLHALAAPGPDLPPWVLTLAGGGDAEALRVLADRLGIGSRVTIEGWLTRPAASALLAGADALVLPSYHEALPLVVLEALSHGVPVITTPVGCLPEFLRDGENALLVPPGDHEALTRAIRRLLTEPALRAGLTQAGRALYENAFTVELFVSRLCTLYRTLALP